MPMLKWLEMGGFAAFVWPAYAIAVTGLLWILISAFRAHERALRELRAQEGVTEA